MRTEELESLTKGRDVPVIDATLWGIVLTSPDAEKLGAFYEDALGYSGAAADGKWTGTLASRRLSITPGAANAIDHAVFALADEAQLGSLRQRLHEASIGSREAAVAGFLEGAVQFADPDGNRFVFGVPAEPTPDATGPGPSARLQHLVLASDQVGPMLRFYADAVGFVPSDIVLDDADDLASVFLRSGKEHHSLAVFRAPRCRLDHFCYDVEDWDQIRDWADRFAARHIPLKWGPGRHGPGNNLFLFINDPDGNWLEFSAELERIDGPRTAGRWVHEERTLNSWGPGLLRS